MTNQMTSHTPGPWERNEDEEITGSNGNLVVSLVDEYGYHFSSGNEAEGNSHLIAAAPDLYRELDAILAALEEGETVIIEPGSVKWSSIKDAIKKTKST